MCDIGFCVAKIIYPEGDVALPCFEACKFNEIDSAIKELETTEIKTEGIMFDGVMIKGKRKQ